MFYCLLNLLAEMFVPFLTKISISYNSRSKCLIKISVCTGEVQAN